MAGQNATARLWTIPLATADTILVTPFRLARVMKRHGPCLFYHIFHFCWILSDLDVESRELW